MMFGIEGYCIMARSGTHRITTVCHKGIRNNSVFIFEMENLKSRHSEGLKSVKIPQILRLAFFWGHGNLSSCNCLICKENTLKAPLIFSFLQQMQWRISIYEPQSFEYNLYQSKSYNKNRDFCIAHKCTPENRNSCVTICYFAF